MPSAKKRGGLGRGLNALVSEAEYETGGSAASASNAASETKLPIEDIVPNPNQPRIHFNETELRELSESIQEHGVLQPLLVRKHGNGYEIIAGERRYQASKLAGLEELPVIIKDVNDEEMLALALIENLQRSDLNPVEEAKGYRQLIDASGMTQEALSKAVSKSRSAITNSLRLLDLPEVVQQMIFEGKLTAGHARAILAVPYEDARIRLAEKVVAEGLSVRATENLAPLFSAGETPKTPRPATPQSFKKAVRVLRQVFNTNVRVKSSRGKNKIEIEFKDEEELSRILGEMIQFDQGGQDEE
ncbi:ParB/RepB/Spo0J family partition protein [Collinsella sp. TF07-1]|uniref:ParB/RepB/Spo0J family partition protein n=1 Tax=Collinsella sp. TF07-1 TaxID=2292332 RepID=UPI0018F25B16|nr:ParB/RepB/Spo0J family partition protein [Collinsella sp. TF07-1]